MDIQSFGLGVLVGIFGTIIVAAVCVYFLSRIEDERIAKHHRGEIT